MKLKLKKSNIKNLSKDAKTVPAELTPQVAGGKVAGTHYEWCDPSHTLLCPPDETIIAR